MVADLAEIEQAAAGQGNAPRGELAQPRPRQSVAAIEAVLEHPSILEGDHEISTVSPSYAG